MRNLISLLIFLLVFSGLQHAVAQSEADFRAQRHEAFRSMIAGYPVEAAHTLLASIRTLPTDNPAIVDIAGGHLQLILFDINMLMTDRTRQEFFTKTLNAKEYEMDAFIATLHEASLKLTPEAAESFLSRLWEFSKSSNDLIAVVSLYLLANPHYTDGLDVQVEASHQMVTRFPDLDATRNMVELPIYYRKLRPAIAGEWIRAYKGKPQEPGKARIRETTTAEKLEAAENTFITNVEPLVDNLSQHETKRQGVEGLLEFITDPDLDWRDRYSYLRMLEPEMKAPPGGAGAQGYWKLIKPGLEVLANQGELTPDVYHARVMLCETMSAAGDFENAAYWAERVLTEQERPYEHPERILYEEAVRAYTEFATHLDRQGLHAEAAKAYERLADFYPNSAIAMEAKAQAAEIGKKAVRAE